MTGIFFVGTINRVKITYDTVKHEKALKERGVDFQDAELLFAGRTLTLLDDRKDYGEMRYQTYGFIRKRLAMVVWTPRGADRRVISMRYCHEKESKKIEAYIF